MGASIMTDPFTGTDRGCVMAAIGVLESAVIHCWPRALDGYRAQIMRASALCPINLEGEEQYGHTCEDLDIVKTRLQKLTLLWSSPPPNVDNPIL